MSDKQHIRTTFKTIEWEDVTFLMSVLRKSTPQDLIRALVSNTAKSERDNVLRYAKSAAVPRETKAQRRAALEAFSDEELTATLKAKGCFEDFKTGEDSEAWVETSELNTRVVRTRSRTAGNDDTTPLTMLMNQWEKRGLIP